MRIDALHLDAVGPFTDRRLDLGAGSAGVHVVHGPNEAGKSSALRALRALLFGFPPRSSDNFLHPYERLRVGATLRPAGGAAFTCVRRKGNKNTLLDETGEPLDEEMLSRLLQGVDEKLFETLFGIDHAGLVRGGETLVKEHGREAEALFGSGLGSNAVHEVRKALEEEAASLYLPQGSRPRVNALLGELREVRKAQREASLAASRWDDLRRDAERARKTLEAVDVEFAAARVRRTALERLRRTLPALARRAELSALLAGSADAPPLPDDFASRRKEAVEARRDAAAGLEHAATSLQSLEAEIAKQAPQRALLDEREAVDALVQRLGEQRQAASDRPALAARRTGIARELEVLAARPGIAGVGAATLAARLSRKRRAEELASQKAAREQALRDASRQLEERRTALEASARRREALPEPVDTAELEEAVRLARDAGDLDAAIEKRMAAQAARERECEEFLAALGRWPRSAQALLEAAFPDDATLGVFAQRFEALAEREQRLHHGREEARLREARADEKLRALTVGGEVPSETALAEARAHRDAGWALLRARWLEGRDVADDAARYAGGCELHDAFEASVGAADARADALLRDAQRVHAHAALLAEREVARDALAQSRGEEQALAADRAALEVQWREAWQAAGIEPASVKEMGSWLTRAERLRERIRAAQAERAELSAAQKSRAAHRRRLSRALAHGSPEGDVAADGSEEMAGLRVRAEQRLEACREAERQRASLDGECTSLQESVQGLERGRDEAREAMAAWQETWAALTADLGVASGVTPAELSEQFEAMQQVSDLQREDAGLEQRLAAMDGSRQGFAQEVAALCARLASELAQRPPEEAVVELNARLARQRELAARQQALRERADAQRQARDEATAALRVAEEAIAELCRDAAGAAPESLEAIEQRDAQLRDARRELAEVERKLTADGDGATPQALAREARGVEAAAVIAELEALVLHMEEELEPRRRELLESAVTAERAFGDMVGGEAAAEHAERAEQLAAAIRAAAERYVRVRLAAKVLREQVEEFRARHRDPILAAASGYLATLTCGDHVAVATEFNAADEAVLCAVDAAGGRRQVDALSTGTRDQLYLALRLATLAHYLEHAEPLPFVVDDILVQFDDARARATLEALADFSRRTQVLLFTHHEQVARDAEALADAGGGVFVHRL